VQVWLSGGWYVFRVKESEMLLVMRIFDKSELAKSQLVLLTTEATLLRQMHHPNVVEVIGDQETDARLCQVFELSVVSSQPRGTLLPSSV